MQASDNESEECWAVRATVWNRSFQDVLMGENYSLCVCGRGGR